MAMGFGESRAWWMIDMIALELAIRTGVPRDMTQQVPEGLPEARAMVRAMLDEATTALSIPDGKLVLGGFSQGAMLALDAALHDPRPLAGAVLLSTTLLAENEWVPRMLTRRGLRVLQSHGERDELLNVAFAERLRDLLREAGLDVRWVPFRGGHEIPPNVIDELGAFLTEVLE
jgi:phospholipase/carboxylesterase